MISSSAPIPGGTCSTGSRKKSPTSPGTGSASSPWPSGADSRSAGLSAGHWTQVSLRLAIYRVPTAEITLDSHDLAELEPVGLITRLEHRLISLEAGKALAIADIDRATAEIGHATASVGKSFAQAADLTVTRDRVRHIDEQLQEAATTRPELDGQENGEPRVRPRTKRAYAGA